MSKEVKLQLAIAYIGQGLLASHEIIEKIDNLLNYINGSDSQSKVDNNKETLRKIYYDFYDELKEPFNSEAKNNWSYELSKNSNMPSSVRQAVWSGFHWDESREGLRYWREVYQYCKN